MDWGFQTSEGNLSVFDEHRLFNYSSRMGDECDQAQKWWIGGVDAHVPVGVSEQRVNLPEVASLEYSYESSTMPNQGADHVEFSPSAMQLIDVPVTFSQSGTNLSEVPPSEDLSGFLSMPTLLNNLTQGNAQAVGTGKPSDAHVQAPADINNPFVSSSFGEGISSVVPTAHSNDDVGFNLWRTYEELMEALSSPSSSYSLLYEQPSRKRRKKDVDVSKNNTITIRSQPTKSIPKSTNKIMVKKSAGKEPLRSFPSNVKSLIGTGVFNEVLVRYVSPSGMLPGVISETGYICGCESCNFSKTLHAHEFEQHANCKTSHPNNHILFENGKSMHQVVQELKAAPRNLLFDVMQTVVGSSINEEAFSAWKESFRGD